jgi:hypothetical protein
MNKTKTILLYIFFVFAVGCKTKQTYIEKVSEKKIDSVYISTKTIETPPILSSLTINQICDTLTGKPKEFKQSILIGDDILELSIKNNNIKLDLERLKRTISKQDSVSRLELSNIHTEITSEIIKYRTDWRIIFILSSLIVLFLFFPTIPKFANSAVRKFLVWF